MKPKFNLFHLEENLNIVDINMSSTPVCAFRAILETCVKGEKEFSAKCLTSHQISTITNASILRLDGFADTLQNLDSSCLNYHSSCYSSYTSKSKIEKAKRKEKKAQESDPLSSPPPPKRLRSRLYIFNDFQSIFKFLTFIIRNMKFASRQKNQ